MSLDFLILQIFYFKIEILNPKTLMYIGCSKNIPVNWSFVD